MGITTTLSSEKPVITLKEIIFEWLTDTNCWNSGSSATTLVKGTPFQDTDIASMNKPLCTFKVSARGNTSTGAGRLAAEAVWLNITIELNLRAKRKDSEYDIAVQGDLLRWYFMDKTLGFSALGGAGLKKAELVGPLTNHEKKYWRHDWFIEGRILVQRAR